MKPKTYRTGLLALGASLLTTSAWAATITVGPSGDHATIQAAVSAATAGDTISLSAGNHSEPGFVVNKAVTISGPNAGLAGTAARGAEARVTDTPITITASGVVLDGLEIHQSTNTGDAVQIQAAATVQNTVFRREGAVTSNGGRGIVTTSAVSGAVITNNFFTGDNSSNVFSNHKTWQSGIYVNGGSLTISNNTFEKVRAALNLDDFNSGISISGNSFSASGTYISLGGVTATTGTHTISGNDFGINLATPGLPSAFVNNSNVASGFRINVSANTFGGVATTALTAADKFAIEARMYHRGRASRNGVIDYVAGQQIQVAGTTLQSAVDAASAGNTILIGGNTTLTSQTTIGKQLTIDGLDKTTAKLTGSAGIGGYFLLFNGASAGSTVRNLTIEKTDKNSQNMIGLQAANLTFNNLTITGQYVLGEGDVARAFEVSGNANGFVISNSSITGLRQPAYINAVSSGSVQNNFVAGTRGWVVDGGLVSFTGNTWGQGGAANAVDIALLASTPYSSLYDPLATLIANNNGATISNQRAVNVINLTQNTGHPTIQSAIDAATAGDTLQAYAGNFSEDVAVTKSVTLRGAGPGLSTITGPIGGASSTVAINASNVTVSGFTITRAGNNVSDWNNPALNSAGISIQGQSLTGTVIHNNQITGMRSAIDINHSNGHTVRNNVITNNHTGLIFRNQTDGITLVENAITANRTVGVLFLDASGGTNSPIQTAASGTFSNNNISGNWYGQIVDRQSGGSLPAAGTNVKNFEGNWLGTSTPVVTTSNSAEPGYASLIPVAFGGTATAPGGQPDVAGPASANLDFKPYLSVATDTDVETTPGRGTYGFQGNASSLWNGTTSSVVINDDDTPPTDVFIPTGTTVTVTSGGALNANELELAPGSTLVVEGGDLNLGDGSKISGSFTIFNSFGSWNVNGDTTFEISQALALVTDIHVAAGKTITVNGGGELILDGCVIDSQTPGSKYNINVANNGLLTVARSVVSDANIDINTANASVGANLKSKVYDNSFTASDIEATADAKVYHNVFDTATDTASNTDATAAFDAIDGWDNVTDVANLQNKFTLEFAAPADADNTLDANGNLFVRPNDAVVVNMNVSALNSNTIVNAEALLGFNSTYIELDTPAAAVVPATGWDVVVEGSSNAGALGLVDSTLGLEFTGPGDDGINANSTIGSIDFTAVAPGATVGFFRVQTDRVFEPGGRLLKDTRLTKSSGGVPSDLTAFTSNTGELVIDAAAPEIAALTAEARQVQPSVLAPVDVFDSANRVFRNGASVELTFDATDNGHGLSGLDAADAIDDLVIIRNGVPLTSGYTVGATESGGLVTYTVTLSIPANTPAGAYAISATVQDRSGNASAQTALGTYTIANEAQATVELQGFTGTTRDVTFVATGGTTKTWTKTVSFTASTGSVILEDVPAGTTAISAKTAWTLRSKVTTAFSPEGVGSAAFTGAKKLLAGDINGDNVVNTFDYSILRFNFTTTNSVADITGDGGVATGDYNLQRVNFYKIGDAQ